MKNEDDYKIVSADKIIFLPINSQSLSCDYRKEKKKSLSQLMIEDLSGKNLLS
jgi:hypothetical protein